MKRKLFLTFVLALNINLLAQVDSTLNTNIEDSVVVDSLNMIDSSKTIVTDSVQEVKQDTVIKVVEEVPMPEVEKVVENIPAKVEEKKEVQQVEMAPVSTPVSYAPKTTVNEVEVKQQYDKAIKMHMSRKYRKSISMMTELLINYPDSKLAGNFQYWIGEALFLLKDYNGSLDAFKKVFSYGDSYKLDDAQYMLGKVNMYKGDDQKALIELESLIMKYPESEYVSKANKLIKKVK